MASKTLVMAIPASVEIDEFIIKRQMPVFVWDRVHLRNLRTVSLVVGLWHEINCDKDGTREVNVTDEVTLEETKECHNINECEEGTHTCPATTICHNEAPYAAPYKAKYRCRCTSDAVLTTVLKGSELISACVCKTGYRREDFKTKFDSI